MPEFKYPTVDMQSVKSNIKTITHEVRNALFLDLDGTLRYNPIPPYRFSKGADQIAVFPGISKTLAKYSKAGYLIFGISNQAGVAFGHKNMKDVFDESSRTMDLLIEQVKKDVPGFDTEESAIIHLITHCPYHENGKVPAYSRFSTCRKPGTGMITQAEEWAFNRSMVLNLSESIMVGDRPEDRELAKRIPDMLFVDPPDFFTDTEYRIKYKEIHNIMDQ